MSGADEGAEQRRQLEAISRLSESDIVQYLMERGAKSECPSCGQNNWSVFHPARDGVMPLALQSPQALLNQGLVFGGGKSIPAMLMLCHNCAFIRPHAAMFIGQWKLDKERGGA
jgi:hypothetical protein